MALVGLIVGYGLAMLTGGSLLQMDGGQMADAGKNPTPSAPSAPTAPAPSSTNDDLPPFDPDTDYYRGDADATIAMIEYSDYECPFCQRHHPTLQQAVDEYSDDVVWVYRHYPLNFHPNAQPTAEAAECIGEIAGNDAFWEFTDMVFEQGSETSKHAGYAQEIGVNQTAFENCVESGKYADKVAQQMAEGSAAGVRGTPGTFIQNRETEETSYISGAQPYSNVKAAIDKLL